MSSVITMVIVLVNYTTGVYSAPVLCAALHCSDRRSSNGYADPSTSRYYYTNYLDIYVSQTCFLSRCLSGDGECEAVITVNTLCHLGAM